MHIRDSSNTFYFDSRQEKTKNVVYIFVVTKRMPWLSAFTDCHCSFAATIALAQTLLKSHFA